MKKKILFGVALFFVILLAVYLIAPVRPAIARWTADRHIGEQYPEYQFPGAESVSVGREGSRALGWMVEWTSDYTAGAQQGASVVTVTVNGWLPFWVEESRVYKVQGNDLTLLEEWPADGGE